ncbi:protein of unknown function [Aminobacter niigataensis]|nr:protein of unknown function [Aminobacter niigataensis]
MFGIDAALLLEPEERPAWAHLRLTLDGQELLDLPAEDDLGAGAAPAPEAAPAPASPPSSKTSAIQAMRG